MYMLENYPTSHFTHFSNRYLDSEKQTSCSSSLYPSCITHLADYVSPLHTSKFCSNIEINNDIYKTLPDQQQTLTGDELRLLTTPPPYLHKPTVEEEEIEEETEGETEEDSDQDDTLINLSRKLRTNLSLAKQRMMNGLKQSSKPRDIAIYTTLKKNTSLSSSSSSSNQKSILTKRPTATIHTIGKPVVGNGRHLFTKKKDTKYRIQKKKPYSRGSSFMELQCNANGFVSVVLRQWNHQQHHGESKPSNPYATLSRSFSFDVEEEDDDDDDDDDDEIMMNNSNNNNNNNNISNNNTNNNNNNKNNNNELLSPLPSLPFDTTMIATPSPHSTSSFTSSPETTIQDIWSPTATIDVFSNTWLNETNPLWSSGHQVSSPFIHSDFNSINQYNENDIDLWLQNGGDSLGCVPLVAATDQELADLLDFDMNATC